MNMSWEITASCFVSKVDILAVPSDMPMLTREIPHSTVGGQCPLKAENRFLPGMNSHIGMNRFWVVSPSHLYIWKTLNELTYICMYVYTCNNNNWKKSWILEEAWIEWARGGRSDVSAVLTYEGSQTLFLTDLRRRLEQTAKKKYTIFEEIDILTYLNIYIYAKYPLKLCQLKI